ncbi:TetR/AcrR family transcriptional regulator [Nocardioides sp. ChNu-153]|uniref:TetR/AcrR family transcriptional regulator n=1 Tax=unclassified Nocardioides TaxID=2615069 RepID=UPI002405F977|nr:MULTISPECIES: TetR/AcrR family transcriptional regulator [unclassified Nocardioides]MDF9714661.1 TetR/AcrR family transcriptional regulator [Nocardioides sp. ChNu-99]MDN7119804.1 TetR/AcrR family transcriptional regulator [Nocardioides sp. ChNu-153]
MATRASTEKKLLDAAEHLLFTRGIAATPVDEVLALAGVSPATLYRAYGSKDGLLAAALERRHDEWVATWEAAVAAATTDTDRLLAVFDALDTFRTRPGAARWCAFLGTAAEYVDPPPPLAVAVARDTTTLRATLRRLAVPVVGEAGADALAEALLLVVSGELAMRLRDTAHEGDGGDGGDGGGTPSVRRDARAVAAALVDHCRVK